MTRALALAAALLLAAPAAALAQWSAPTSLTGDVAAAFGPQALTTSRGDRVVTYGLGGELRWSRAYPGQDAPWHREFSSSPVGARLLTYASRSLLIVNRTEGRLPWELHARFGAFGAGFRGSERRIAPGEDVLTYAPAVDARGDAVVAYVQNVRRGTVVLRRVVRVVTRPAGGSLGRPRTIAGSGSPTAVGAAVGAGGEIVVAYERQGRLLVRRREPGHAWLAPQDLGAAVKGHTQIDVAASAGGMFAVAWFAQELTEGGDNGPAAVCLAVRNAGGHRFHAARTFETFAQRAPQGAAVRVALASDGTGVLGWTGRQGDHFVARVADLTGTTGTTVSDPTAAMRTPDSVCAVRPRAVRRPSVNPTADGLVKTAQP